MIILKKSMKDNYIEFKLFKLIILLNILKKRLK